MKCDVVYLLQNTCVVVVQKLAGEVWNKLAVEDKEGWQKHSKERVME